MTADPNNPKDAKTPPNPAGYCASCGYWLQGLVATDESPPVFRCPECGRVFDPKNPKTFRVHQHGRIVRWLAKPMGWPMVILSLAAAAGVLLVTGWHWTTSPSAVDLVYYLNLQRPFLARHDSLVTWRDWVYTLSLLAAICTIILWFLKLFLTVWARHRMGSLHEAEPVHIGRRHALLAIGVAFTSAGAFLGWPYRLAQNWIARRMAIGNQPFVGATSVVPQANISGDQTEKTLRMAVMEMPQAKQRMTGLQLLIEDYPSSALAILTDAVKRESDSDVRALELRLVGLHREIKTVDLLRGFLNHSDPETRAAAADALGILYAPEFDVPLGGHNISLTLGPTAVVSGNTKILIDGLTQLHSRTPGARQPFLMTPFPIGEDIRAVLEKMMSAGSTPNEREAAARALIRWQPQDYQLRIAEWGVWIGTGGKLELVQSILDEIPPFVHRTGNPLSEFGNRVNQIMIINKPIIHITVNQPLAVDMTVMITRGRPWFAYPKPDDFAVKVEQVHPTRKTPSPNTKILGPTEKPSIGKLTNLSQGYPWLLPNHIIAGSWGSGMGDQNVLTSLGLCWQSVIVSPTQLSWMKPPEVGTDPKFAWWKRLRDVPSSWISSRGESERFLYYDGPTLAAPPVGFTLAGQELSMTLKQEDAQAAMEAGFPTRQYSRPPQSILWINHKDGKLNGESIPLPPGFDGNHPKGTHTLSEESLHENQVINEFRRMLTDAGLTVEEAEGLVASWMPQFFQTPGKRVLCIMARADYDFLCPIEIRPWPTEMVRVGIILTEFA